MTTTELLPWYGRGQRIEIIKGGNKPHLVGKQGTFERHLRKNVEIRIDGDPTVWRLDPRMIKPVTDHDGKPVFGKIHVEPRPEWVEPPRVGQVVTCDDATIRQEPQLKGLWVVVGGQGDKSRLARINGTPGRFDYWRIPNRNLTVVTVRDLELAL